jgi:hypothetical protein
VFNSKKPTEKVTEQVTEHVPSKSPLKVIAIVAGSLFAASHIGLLGYVLRPQEPAVQQPPTFSLPRGPYSSYKIKVGKEGYEIEYKADDPKVLTSERSSDLDKTKKGFLGGGSEKRTEYRRDEYTREGARNTGAGGAVIDSEGKSAKEIECIVADAGARSQGATVGSSLATGLIIPAVSSIPYVGFLAGGWALLLGQKVGSELGSQVGSAFNDC